MNLQNRKGLTDVENGLKVAEGRDRQGVWEGHAHAAVFKMDNQQGPPVQHVELHSVLCASLDGRGAWRTVGTCICKAESLRCSPETTLILLISYILIQNRKFKV